MAATMSFLAATKARRSITALKNESPIPDRQIVEIVQHAILHAPSPFDVQSCRAIVLFKKEHEKLWDIAKKRYRRPCGQHRWLFLSPNSRNIAVLMALFVVHSFLSGVLALTHLLIAPFFWATQVMFFEDTTAAQSLPSQWGNLLIKYPELWTALSAEGLGCNLQHYQPGISAHVAAEWNVPIEWGLRAQLVFGLPYGPPRGGEKTFRPLEERVKVYGE